MDNLRGSFDTGLPADESQGWDAANDAPEENTARELPPEAIGQDERRMQVRAYNHWASLLGDATFPSIEDLEPHNLTDFGPNSVLLDFSAGIDDPIVQYLGEMIATECGTDGSIERLSDVPPRSLLSRITDHYMQILANQAPIGFEAEFVNQRDASILYRGILLPFSSDDETIDFIYGVINWKEMADAATADELLLEIDQAIEGDEEVEEVAEDVAHKHPIDPVTEWADSPAHEPTDVSAEPISPLVEPSPAWAELEDNLDELGTGPSPTDDDGIPLPDFGQYHLDDPEVDEFGEEIIEGEENDASYSFASLTDYIEAPEKKAVDLDAGRFDPDDYQVDAGEAPEQVLPAAPISQEATFEPAITPAAPQDIEAVELPADAGMHDCLARAREMAETARAYDDRSRQALYAAVSRAYDFSLAAQDEPEAYAELIEDNGLTIQDRAPMTPIVKLVFGLDYNKTRLAEYATVLTHAQRHNLGRGALADFLSNADGGLKGVVAAERRLRREESGQEVLSAEDLRAQLTEKLRELEELTLDAVSGEGPEFSLVMLRRDGAGNVGVVGEISDDTKLIERVAKKLVG